MLRQFASLRLKSGLPAGLAADEADEEGEVGRGRLFVSSESLPPAALQKTKRRAVHRQERAHTLTAPPLPLGRQRGESVVGVEKLEKGTPTPVATVKPPKARRRKDKLKHGLFHSISTWSLSSAPGSDSLSSGSSSTSVSASQLWDDAPADVVTQGAAVIARLVRLKTVPFREWGVADVCMWLDLLCMGMYIPAFRRNEVTGQYLTQIDKHDLRSMGMKSIGHRKRFERRLKMLIDGDEAALDEPSITERRGAKNSTSLWTLSCNPPSHSHTLRIPSFSISSMVTSRKDKDQDTKKSSKTPSKGNSISGIEDILSSADELPHKYSGTIDGLIESLTSNTTSDGKQTEILHAGKSPLAISTNTPSSPLPRQLVPKGSVIVMIDHWEKMSNSSGTVSTQIRRVISDETQDEVIALAVPEQKSAKSTSPRALKNVFSFTRNRSNSRSTASQPTRASGKGLSATPDSHRAAPRQEVGKLPKSNDNETETELSCLRPVILTLRSVEAHQRPRRLSIPITPREKVGTEIILRLREDQRRAEDQKQRDQQRTSTQSSHVEEAPARCDWQGDDHDVANVLPSVVDQTLSSSKEKASTDEKADRKEKKAKKAKKHKKAKKEPNDDTTLVSKTLSESGSKSLKRSKRRSTALSSSKSAVSASDAPAMRRSKLNATSLERGGGKEVRRKLSMSPQEAVDVKEIGAGRTDNHHANMRAEEAEQSRRALRDKEVLTSTAPKLRRRGTVEVSGRSEIDGDHRAMLPMQGPLDQYIQMTQDDQRLAKEHKKKERKEKSKRKRKDRAEIKQKGPTEQLQHNGTSEWNHTRVTDRAKDSNEISNASLSGGNLSDANFEPVKSTAKRKKKLGKPESVSLTKLKKKKKKKEKTKTKPSAPSEGGRPPLPNGNAAEMPTTITRTREQALSDLDDWWWRKRSSQVMIKCVWGEDVTMFFVRSNISLPQLRHRILSKLGKPSEWRFIIKSRTNLHRRLVTLDKTTYLRGAIQYHLTCRDPRHPLGRAAMRLYLCEI